MCPATDPLKIMQSVQSGASGLGKSQEIKTAHIVYFCYFHCSRNGIKKDIAVIYVQEWFAYAFLEELYHVQPYIQVFDPFLLLFFVHGVKECSNLII